MNHFSVRNLEKMANYQLSVIYKYSPFNALRYNVWALHPFFLNSSSVYPFFFFTQHLVKKTKKKHNWGLETFLERNIRSKDLKMSLFFCVRYMTSESLTPTKTALAHTSVYGGIRTVITEGAAGLLTGRLIHGNAAAKDQSPGCRIGFAHSRGIISQCEMKSDYVLSRPPFPQRPASTHTRAQANALPFSPSLSVTRQGLNKGVGWQCGTNISIKSACNTVASFARGY